MRQRSATLGIFAAMLAAVLLREWMYLQRHWGG